MNTNILHFDKRVLIGWMIAILIPVYLSSMTNKNNQDNKEQDNYRQVAVQEQKIMVLEKNETILFNKINIIESNTQDTHDNMIMLMMKEGLEPVLISSNKNKNNR